MRKLLIRLISKLALFVKIEDFFTTSSAVDETYTMCVGEETGLEVVKKDRF